MAEATLNDVILRLRTDNEKQVREQRETTTAVEELSGTIRAFLEEMEAQRLRDKEKDFESRRKASPTAAAPATAASTGLGGLLEGFTNAGLLGTIASSIGAFTAGLAGFVAATEGLGPSIAGLRSLSDKVIKFQKFLAKPITWPFEKMMGMSLWDDAADQLTKMEKLLKGRYTFDERTMRWKNLLTGKFAPFDEVEEAAKSASRLFARIENLFSSIKIPDSVAKAFDNIKFPEIKIPDIKIPEIKIPESVIKSFDSLSNLFGPEGALGKAFEAVKNNAWIGKFVRFTNVLAAVLSIVDGIGVAMDEVETREGFFNKYLGGAVGGFLGGTLGSFFGELANLIKNIPLWLISWVVPEDWITIDEAAGTWKFDDSKNIFTKALAGLQALDFNKMIKDIIMIPFDALGNAFDWIGEYMGWSGSSEDQAAAQKQFDDWWSNWKSLNGIAENVTTLGAAIINMALSPVNAVLNSVMQAFGMQEEGAETTFIEKMKEFVTWVYSFVPSVDDIKRKLATSIGPGYITDFLGLAEYLPMSEADFKARSAELLGTAQESQSEIEALTAELNAAKNRPDRFRAPIERKLTEAQEEFTAAQQELQTMVDTARTAGGINSSVVNNVQSQSDAIFMPNSGSIDNDDIRR
jgi:hypothetical protein